MRTSGWVILASLITIGADVEAGRRRGRQADATPPHQLVTPNGVVVPTWATRRIENSPVPLYGYSGGRRPWAYPLAHQDTPSARMARADQLGVGAGPIPGYTNGPPLGNYPQAAVGPTGIIPARRGVGYPFNLYLNGN